MATLKEMKTYLVDKIVEVIGSGEVYGYPFAADNIESPAVMAMNPPDISAEFDKAFNRGLDQWNIWLMVAVAMTDAELAEEKLDEFLSRKGPLSIPKIIWEMDDMPDGTTFTATGVRGYGARRTIGTIQYVGAVITVTARTSG